MTKVDLIAAVAEKAALTREGARRAIDALTEIVRTELAAGGYVNINGFGKFTTRQRAARPARNPRTGETVAVPAKRVPVFRPGQDLKAIS